MSTSSDRPTTTTDDATEEPAAAPVNGVDLAAPPERWRAVIELLIVLAVGGSLLLLAGGLGALTSRIAGSVLVVGCAAYVSTRALFPFRVVPLIFGTVGAALGVTLVLSPHQGLDSVGRIAGLAFAMVGIWYGVQAITADGSRRRNLAIAALSLAVGVAFFFVPDQLFLLALWVVALVVGLHQFIRTGVKLGLIHLPGRTDEPLLIAWIGSKRYASQERQEVCDQVFFEGPNARERLARFGLLMLFSSVISAMGVLTDSTAVVIGAMLVAPLITPMMGMGLSLAMGWPRRLGESALAVIVGMAIAIATGWFLAATTGLAVDLQANSQVVSRSSPTVADLIIAVAAGAAGAYALSRKDVSSSLPGVAIAIALVPPLSVLGVTCEQQAWNDAAGTLLLFLTNLVAILVVGGTVFLLTGVAPLAKAAANQERVRSAAAFVAALALLVVAGLVLNGQAITRDSLSQSDATQGVAQWLGPDSDFSVVSVDVNKDDVAVILAGPGAPPPTAELARFLAERLGHRVVLDLQWIPRQRQHATASP